VTISSRCSVSDLDLVGLAQGIGLLDIIRSRKAWCNETLLWRSAFKGVASLLTLAGCITASMWLRRARDFSGDEGRAVTG